VWFEYLLMAICWGLILGLAAMFSAWKILLAVYVIPGILAGDIHSLRKYTEHMGMMGSTVLSTTRSVVSKGWIGRMVAFSTFNIPFHGVHHRYAKIPQARLPEFASLLTPSIEQELAPYGSYWSALCDMVRSLANPRIGAQWIKSV
jgi:fatty acid desaturase